MVLCPRWTCRLKSNPTQEHSHTRREGRPAAIAAALLSLSGHRPPVDEAFFWMLASFLATIPFQSKPSSRLRTFPKQRRQQHLRRCRSPTTIPTYATSLNGAPSAAPPETSAPGRAFRVEYPAVKTADGRWQWWRRGMRSRWMRIRGRRVMGWMRKMSDDMDNVCGVEIYGD